nr:MAG TPA: hypothetical protein [Caudoviricetes sp.]
MLFNIFVVTLFKYNCLYRLMKYFSSYLCLIASVHVI